MDTRKRLQFSAINVMCFWIIDDFWDTSSLERASSANPVRKFPDPLNRATYPLVFVSADFWQTAPVDVDRRIARRNEGSKGRKARLSKGQWQPEVSHPLRRIRVLGLKGWLTPEVATGVMGGRGEAGGGQPTDKLWQLSFPPFYTLQPHAETRRKQVWSHQHFCTIFLLHW